jgi:hypothetical protein
MVKKKRKPDRVRIPLISKSCKVENRAVGNTRQLPHATKIAIGIFIKKRAFQLKYLRKIPAITGPNINAIPKVAPISPNILPRFSIG